MLITSARGGNVDIYVMEADGSDARRLTTDPGIDSGADWTPEGFQFAFMSTRDGDYEIYTMFANGRGLQQLTNNRFHDGFPHWSPNGRASCSPPIATACSPLRDERRRVERRATQRLRRERGRRMVARRSKIAFLSTQDGASEIYVMQSDGMTSGA